MTTITPEQQITNLIRSLNRWANYERSQPGRMWNIKQAVAQLDEYWDKYRKGELESITDELPF